MMRRPAPAMDQGAKRCGQRIALSIHRLACTLEVARTLGMGPCLHGAGKRAPFHVSALWSHACSESSQLHILTCHLADQVRYLRLECRRPRRFAREVRRRLRQLVVLSATAVSRLHL